MKWIKKILLLIVTVFFAMSVTFTTIHFMPGDPVQTMAMDMQRNLGITYNEAYLKAKAQLNYDPDIPLVKQYINYVSGLLRGNFGESMIYKQSVGAVLAGSLPWTLFILSIALFLSFTLGVLLGTYMAWKRKTILEPIVNIYTSIFGSIPDFIVAFLLIILLAVKFKIFPSRGPYDSTVIPGLNGPFIASVLKHATLPILAFFLTTVGGWALMMKGSSTSVLGEDYITSARARGLEEGRIVKTYVAKNAMLPLVTSLAVTFGMLFGGSPLVENIFVYPGVGYFMGQATGRRDFTLMQGMFLMITIATVTANLVAEILYTILDPRVRD
jgi:peptide/nickel transport system permease protein